MVLHKTKRDWGAGALLGIISLSFQTISVQMFPENHLLLLTQEVIVKYQTTVDTFFKW